MDLVLRNLLLAPGRSGGVGKAGIGAGVNGGPVDIAIAGGRIAALAPHDDGAFVGAAQEHDLGGLLALPGFIETHIHLDKACILERCPLHHGTLAEAISLTATAKAAFTEEDIEVRGARVIEKAIAQGTMRLRTHVEIDPGIGLAGFHAVQRLAERYRWAVQIEICVFPQEGLLNRPGTEELLVTALEEGARLLGGCPYTDSDPEGQIIRLFALARRFDVDLDFHLDFDLDPKGMTIEAVCDATDAAGWGGRVTIGHASKLSALPPADLTRIARRMAASGVALTVLPATDLFLMGRGHDHLVPRGMAPAHRLLAEGVNCSLSTNNVLNPFTPFGDLSLTRMANLYANIAQLGRPAEMAECLEMVTSRSARLMNLADYGIAVGNPADLVLVDCKQPWQAVAEIAPPLMGFHRGRLTFERPRTRLYPPS
ncbi:amidohydrolase family protein [Radicibacter daui]|uniref:amidohydrolase family protein n=1 Tax=Radicibacter daui TaxID=3064829 RepID=UPI004046A7D4